MSVLFERFIEEKPYLKADGVILRSPRSNIVDVGAEVNKLWIKYQMLGQMGEDSETAPGLYTKEQVSKIMDARLRIKTELTIILEDV